MVQTSDVKTKLDSKIVMVVENFFVSLKIFPSSLSKSRKNNMFWLPLGKWTWEKLLTFHLGSGLHSRDIEHLESAQKYFNLWEVFFFPSILDMAFLLKIKNWCCLLSLLYLDIKNSMWFMFSYSYMSTYFPIFHDFSIFSYPLQRPSYLRYHDYNCSALLCAFCLIFYKLLYLYCFPSRYLIYSYVLKVISGKLTAQTPICEKNVELHTSRSTMFPGCGRVSQVSQHAQHVHIISETLSDKRYDLYGISNTSVDRTQPLFTFILFT